MSLFVIALVICSALTHAGWNLLARKRRCEAAFFFRMNLVIVSIGFLPAVIAEIMTQSLPTKAWLCLIGSGVFCGIYTFCLARSYELSDFTVVYPIARALPVLLVGFVDVLRGRFVTTPAWFGLLFVALGCFLAPLHSFREIDAKRYLTKASIWMVLTALGTVGYSMFDKIASEAVHRGPATAAIYGYMFFLSAGIFYALLLFLFKRAGLKDSSVGWKGPFWAACMNFGGYWLILWAYQLSRHLSYVVAFRQLSIIFGVVLAFAIYKERCLTVRLTGAVIISAGLILISIWGG